MDCSPEARHRGVQCLLSIDDPDVSYIERRAGKDLLGHQAYKIIALEDTPEGHLVHSPNHGEINSRYGICS